MAPLVSLTKRRCRWRKLDQLERQVGENEEIESHSLSEGSLFGGNAVSISSIDDVTRRQRRSHGTCRTVHEIGRLFSKQRWDSVASFSTVMADRGSIPIGRESNRTCWFLFYSFSFFVDRWRCEASNGKENWHDPSNKETADNVNWLT